MIRTTNDLSRSNPARPASQGNDCAASVAPGTTSAAGASSASTPPASQHHASKAGLADLKRLTQSLKPRRQTAEGIAGQPERHFEQPIGLAQPYANEQFSAPAQLIAPSGLPRRRPVSLENVMSLKQQSKAMLEQMAGPSARALLLSSLFQSKTTDR